MDDEEYRPGFIECVDEGFYRLTRKLVNRIEFLSQDKNIKGIEDLCYAGGMAIESSRFISHFPLSIIGVAFNGSFLFSENVRYGINSVRDNPLSIIGSFFRFFSVARGSYFAVNGIASTVVGINSGELQFVKNGLYNILSSFGDITFAVGSYLTRVRVEREEDNILE
jgi:hypothetical protein